MPPLRSGPSNEGSAAEGAAPKQPGRTAPHRPRGGPQRHRGRWAPRRMGDAGTRPPPQGSWGCLSCNGGDPCNRGVPAMGVSLTGGPYNEVPATKVHCHKGLWQWGAAAPKIYRNGVSLHQGFIAMGCHCTKGYCNKGLLQRWPTAARHCRSTGKAGACLVWPVQLHGGLTGKKGNAVPLRVIFADQGRARRWLE